LSRIAVVGSGIAGLGAAYFLSRKHTVFLFEKDNRIGGHTHTHTVASSLGPIKVDTGFIVHNDRTYPNLIRLLAELGVERMPSDMSFGVFQPSTGFEYSSRGLNGFFARRRHALNPAHYALLAEIMRFNAAAPKLLDQPASNITLGEYLDQNGFSQRLTDKYLVPMASAIWSMDRAEMMRFPAFTLIRFFHNHGMLGINTHPQWYTLRGGCSSYLNPISKPFADRITLNANITAIRRTAQHVTLEFADRPAQQFDQVVLACHGPQALQLLADPSDKEREILSNFRTSRNVAILHTDEKLLPRREAAQASWNYNLDGANGATLTYAMNRLQSIPTREQFCVTLNDGGMVDESKVIQRIVYHHPIYDQAAVAAQDRWHEISGLNRTHFCGAYWFYGFHEDGLRSGIRVAETLESAWPENTRARTAAA
jgi:predicted NAD/FAD-binding protein